jgi:hypothetical protein
LQAAIPQENFLLISTRTDLHIQVATRGCRQSGSNNMKNETKEKLVGREIAI